MESVLRFRYDQFEQMRKHLLGSSDEDFCWLFAKSYRRDGLLVHIVQKIYYPHPHEYIERSSSRVSLKDDARYRVYKSFIESDCDTIINCHSHPFDNTDSVCFSSVDDRDDHEEMEFLIDQIPIGKRNVGQAVESIYAYSLVIGQRSIDARGYDRNAGEFLDNRRFYPVSRIHVPGRREGFFIYPRSAKREENHSKKSEQIFDRQSKAFELSKIREQRICIVGAGGVGSIIGESLARSGFYSIMVIDDDILEYSNLNRWQGGSEEQVSQCKAQLLVERLQKLFPDGEFTYCNKPLYEAVDEISASDFIVSVVDNHLARYVLNQISTRYLLPLLDAGTLLSNEPISAQFSHRFFIPGLSVCMDCSMIDFYDKKEIAQSFYSKDTQQRMRQAGYIEDDPQDPGAAVMAVNQIVSGYMVYDLLKLICGSEDRIHVQWTKIEGMNNEIHRQSLDIDAFKANRKPCLLCDYYGGDGDDSPITLPSDY